MYNGLSFMKKEVVIAVLIGLSLGLIVTYGIYTARRSLMSTNSSLPTPTPSSTPAPTSSVLSVVSPDDESLQFTSDVKIAGTTKPGSLVIIFINDKYQITHADQSGNFGIGVQLDEGSNVITTRAIDDNGQTVDDQRTVIYSTTDLTEPVASSSATVVATPSAKLKKTKVTPSPSPSTTP